RVQPSLRELLRRRLGQERRHQGLYHWRLVARPGPLQEESRNQGSSRRYAHQETGQSRRSCLVIRDQVRQPSLCRLEVVSGLNVRVLLKFFWWSRGSGAPDL